MHIKIPAMNPNLLSYWPEIDLHGQIAQVQIKAAYHRQPDAKKYVELAYRKNSKQAETKKPRGLAMHHGVETDIYDLFSF